jgi:hypothetical protein
MKSTANIDYRLFNQNSKTLTLECPIFRVRKARHLKSEANLPVKIGRAFTLKASVIEGR